MSIQAEVLTQALPYIKKYSGKIVAIKYGGHAMSDDLSVMKDIALLRLVGVKVVLIHGGGPEINQMTKRLGKVPDFVDGLRVTDDDMIEIVQMVLAGKINKTLVNLLELQGAEAVGLSGVDGNLIEATTKNPKLGFVGNITKINPKIILDLLEKNYIPVISTIARGSDGSIFNINGDTAAAYIAGSLKAERLIMMTDTPGILRDKNNPDTLIHELNLTEASQLFSKGIISEGMIPKVECCIEAVRLGVQNVIVINGKTPHALLIELLTDDGAGTLIKK